MKFKILLLSYLSLLLVNMLSAQVPQMINYEAVARYASGNTMANATLPVRFSILEGINGLIKYLSCRIGLIGHN